ncbi:hypothetical protein BT96DRAFT_923983 [Gymnopus androsaceus JB14]|uniref:Uncharacterized protein n=1 Tax=Gymnopus androsaceus JB14 TaxID=1447944 RepID=A0A6A4H6R0_9AGAR|nr:hypothetical protein BT96DRAFT_923983 [Gymnopus androsaceus JB14]
MVPQQLRWVHILVFRVPPKYTGRRKDVKSLEFGTVQAAYSSSHNVEKPSYDIIVTKSELSETQDSPPAFFETSCLHHAQLLLH